MLRIAIDTGGTFTDVAAVDEHGRQWLVKAATDAENPAEGVLAALDELAGRLGLELPVMLAQTDRLVHGTTLGINALLQGRGARTALLTTEGFRDALEMRRSRRAEQWDLRAPVPPVLVPRRLRLGVRERVDYRGEVTIPLDREQVAQLASTLDGLRVEAVAICFLFSFLQPTHEHQTAELLRRLLPGVFVSASVDVAPRIREYERTSTTVLNAYLGPLTAAYLGQLEEMLAAQGWHRPLHLPANNVGVTDAASARIAPTRTLLSGPAGGVRGGQRVAAALGRRRLVVADMGGTSFDVHLVNDGAVAMVPGGEVAGYPVALPLADIHSVAVAGGSMVGVDGTGMVAVGPRSAGAVPGPACYGRGGVEPTVTDAAVVLGLLDPHRFWGGRLPLDVDAALRAMQKSVAQPLGLDVESSALAVYRVTIAAMADAVRLLTVQRGLDPRDFSLVAAGGAFPLFAADVAQELGMPEVLVPPAGPTFCAWGMLAATCRHDVVRNFLLPKDRWDEQTLEGLVHDMRTTGLSELHRLGVPEERCRFELVLEMRYVGQHHEIDVTVDDGGDGSVADRLGRGRIDAAFHQRHRELRGFAEPDRPWELVHLRVTCSEHGDLTVPEPGGSVELHGGLSHHLHGEVGVREVYLGGGHRQMVSAYPGSNLPSVAAGPALIDFPYTTVVVPPGWTARHHRQGSLVLRRVEA